MKTEKRHKFYGWIAFVFVIFHFGFVFIYATPVSVFGEDSKAMVERYVSPVFSQKWSLFAPCPIVNAYTEVAFEFEGEKKTDWIKVGDEPLRKHSFTKGLHYGELVLIESNLMFSVNADLEEVGLEAGSMPSKEKLDRYVYLGRSVHRVRRYLYGLAFYLFNEKPTKGYFRCWRNNVETGLGGIIELPSYDFK